MILQRSHRCIMQHRKTQATYRKCSITSTNKSTKYHYPIYFNRYHLAYGIGNIVRSQHCSVWVTLHLGSHIWSSQKGSQINYLFNVYPLPGKWQSWQVLTWYNCNYWTLDQVRDQNVRFILNLKQAQILSKNRKLFSRDKLLSVF